LRAGVAIAALASSSALAQGAATGSAVLVGQVKLKESGQPLGYSVVAIPSLSRQQFTSDRGGFTLWNLPAGPLRIRFKHIGNAPRDTVVTLHENDTIRIEIALALLAIQLPAVHISGACGNQRPDERSVGVLNDLFDQVQQNADRYRLLADSNPFELILYHVHGLRGRDGKILATSIDTVKRGPFPFSPYTPRHLIRTEVDSGPDRRVHHYLAVPELADFADTAVVNNHCFTYAGQRKLDGDSVIAVDFEPVPSLKDEVDFHGTVYVRAAGYQLIRAEMELNRIPPELRSSGMMGMSITSLFTEVVPGVAILQQVESTTKFRGQMLLRAELGQVMNMKWVKGPP
jgi:hypothetical protein